MNNEKVEIKFAKLHPDAEIPHKRDEDAGYDIYPSFDEDYILLNAGETKLIPTGICSAFSDDYVMILKERGSTGTKGIGQRSGVIDSGYRGEWMVPITNHNTTGRLFISKYDKGETLQRYIEDTNCFVLSEDIVYSYEKAIAQALLIPVPKSKIIEVTAEEIQNIPSERGDGKLGSSGK